MATSNSNRRLVPEAKESLDKFKYEVASDIAVKNIFEKQYLKLLHFCFNSFSINSHTSLNL